MPKLIIQPDEFTCGQCCVAMAAGVPLSRVTCSTPTDGMTTADVRKALLKFGISSARRMHPVGEKGLGAMAHGRAMLHTVQRGGPPKGHWVLLWDGGVFDPAGPYTTIYYPTTIVSYLKIHKLDWRE